MTKSNDAHLDLSFFNANAPPKDKLRSAVGACGMLAEAGDQLLRRIRDPFWDENDDTVLAFNEWLDGFDELLETVEDLRENGDEAGAASLVACMADLVAFKRDKLLL